MSFPYRIERLVEQDRQEFDCGTAELNDYLCQRAGQDQRRRVAACYLLVEESTGAISGYYTLSAGSVLLADLPKSISKKLPRYPSVPVAKVGRLAIDHRFQGQGLGGALLYDAVKRTATSELGVYAVVVDAKDDSAVEFYEHHGYIQFESKPTALFLPISMAIKKLVDK